MVKKEPIQKKIRLALKKSKKKRRKMKKILLLLFLGVFLIGIVSAFTFDNIKSYEKETKTITIKNAFGLGEDLEKATLISNTYNCAERCGAEKEITLYDDGVLINDLRFYRLFTDGSKKLDEPRGYNLKYYTDVGDAVYNVVEVLKNGTEIKEYSHLDYNGINLRWVNYELGTEVKAGTYQVKLEGIKKVNRIYDWQIQLQGRWINEWATWGNISLGDDAEVLLISPIDNFSALIGDAIYYNATANVTGGATLTNMSLYTDSSGTWLLNETIAISGIPILDVYSATLIQGESTTLKTGMKINTNIELSVLIITQGSLVGATKAYVAYGSNKSVIATADFVGVNATFSPSVALGDATDYWLFVDSDGSSYNSRFSAEISGYPEVGTNIDWIKGQTLTGETTLRWSSVIGVTTEEPITFSSQNFSKVVLGETIWNVQACDSDGDCGFAVSNRTVRVIPVINVFSPTNSSFTTPTIFFNATSSESIDKWIVNYNGTNVTLLDINTTLEVEDGNHHLLLYANGSATGVFGLNNSIFFSIDITAPNISVTSPTGDQGIFVSGRNLTLSWNVTDVNLDTCWYDYESTNTTVICSLNTTNFTVIDSSLTFLTFYANDTLGQESSDSTSWSYSFIENNVIFNENASETSSQFFEMNLSTGLSVLSISANLNYDGTNYFSASACGDFCLVNNTIDIPLVSTGESELKSFFWDINIFNGTDSINVNTTTRTQNVSRIHLETCDGTFTVQSLNFTTYNEQNLSRISPFTFDGTFDIWLGSGDVKRNNSFSDSSIVEKTLCIFPNATYFVDSEIQYNEPGNTTYITRDYYFQNDTINNISQDIFLYLLPSSVSTSFILKVQDTNLLPLENYLIIIQRFYPGENLFRTVQIARTGANGKTVGFFETETVDYRFIIKRNGRTLLTTTQQKIVGEVAPFTITFTLGEDLGKPWETLENLTNFQYSLGFEQSTNIVTYTYTDTSGNFTLGTLVVERQNFSFASNTVLCNIDSPQSSATITCNITGNGTGTYVAKGFVTRANIETLINQFNFIIESFSQVAGFLGVLLAWFLILISSFAFKFNEIAGIFMINATVIFVNIIGLVSFGMLAISALIGVSIIIAVVMEK